jgi:ribonuclease D
MTSALEHVPRQYEWYDGDLPSSVCDELLDTDRISWDIETSGLDWKSDRIALCQIHSLHGPVRLVRMAGDVPWHLRELIRNERVMKVFHHAMFDLRFLSHQWEVEPANIACTKIAAKLLMPDEPDEQKLQRLLFRFLGIEIDKALQTSDWLSAGYSRAQIAYAIQDVVHLGDLLDVLRFDLERRGLLRLAERCFDHIPARVALELGRFGDVFRY